MMNALQKVLKNRSTRVLILLFIVLISLISYSLINSYYVQLEIHKQKVLSRLDAIATTTSSHINGDYLQAILVEYKNEDDITDNKQDFKYELINDLLSKVKAQNNISSEIYTLTYDSTKNEFFFGVSSSKKPYYRHVYDHFPQELVTQYEVGGKIGVYEDKNGYWLSAFAPIFNSKDKIVGILQVDSLFDEFIQEARDSIFINILISLVLMVVLVLILIRSVRAILRTEDALKSDLIASKHILEEQNQDIVDSINYANKIQEAILSNQSSFQLLLEESFILFKPRDIVSGDFYWFKEVDGFKIIASVDCTGHGVPGAFMSMIGSILLDDIVKKQKMIEPNLILDELNKDVVQSLKQDSEDADSRDGMDVSLCMICEQSKNLYYAGANRPLVYIRNNEIVQIKGDAYPIGGLSNERPPYSCHKVPLKDGDIFYIFSDGYPDQFGGEKNKKYMTPRFRKFLLSISKHPLKEQKQLLDDEFNRWKGGEEQVDDVLVMGFKV